MPSTFRVGIYGVGLWFLERRCRVVILRTDMDMIWIVRHWVQKTRKGLSGGQDVEGERRSEEGEYHFVISQGGYMELSDSMLSFFLGRNVLVDWISWLRC
jgi:hypothetical protein